MFSVTSTNSSFAVTLLASSLPSNMASAIAEQNKLIDRIASSLPGITWSTPSGSLLVSTIPITGIPSLLASLTAIRS